MSRWLHFPPVYLRKKTPSFHLIGGFAGPTSPKDYSQKNILFASKRKSDHDSSVVKSTVTSLQLTG